MAVDDKYLLKDKQTFRAQQVINTYYFVQTAGAGTADALVAAFKADMLPELIAVQSTFLTHESIEVINLDDPTDFYEEALSASNVGTVSGEMAPVFVAWGYRLLRASRLSRNGYKRIAGVGEADLGDGDAASAALTRLNALATVMGGTITDTVTSSTWKPVIMSRSGVAPNIVYTPNDVSGAEYISVTSQNSRKYGRGS